MDNNNTIAFRAFNLINQRRQSYGKQPLAWEPSLYNLCLEHTFNLSTGRAFAHEGMDGRTARIEFQWNGVAENVCYNYNDSDPALEAVNQWMNSSGHFRNLMGNYNVSALACVRGRNGVYYFTQMFVNRC